MFRSLLLSAFFVSALSSTVAWSDTFYVDPANGSPSGDGSQANPWQTLQGLFDDNLIESQKAAVFPYNGTLQVRNPGAPVKAGDTIKLLDGYHGDIFERGYFNSNHITIEAEAGHTPTLKGFHMQAAKNWTLRGLTVSPEFASVVDTGSIVRFETHSFHGPASDAIIEDMTIYSIADSSAWTATDWTTKAARGIQVAGNDFTIRNNRVSNISQGIATSGDDILAIGNSIENYSLDGMRGGGDRVTYENNSIKWSYNVDGNHDDAIQFFRSGGVAHHDVVLRGNYVESYPDPTRPLTHAAQGLGIFDGPYIDWVIENNVVMTSDLHGISIYEAENALIVNNTVIDITGQTDTWIRVQDSTNSTIRNNVSKAIFDTGSTGTTIDNNLILTTPQLDQIFEDWQNGDLRLKAGGAAIDAGSSILAPAEDINGTPRPIGSGIDIGAYELSLAGDYNFDGIVDAADYTVWRDSLGSTSELAADGDGNGTVEQADYSFWQDRFGDSLNSNTNAVPEPCSVSLLCLALAIPFHRLRRLS